MKPSWVLAFVLVADGVVHADVSVGATAKPTTGAAHAKPRAEPKADAVIIAFLLRAAGPTHSCGKSFSIGEEEYRVVRVESGTLAATEIVVDVPCPSDGWMIPLNGLVRLYLDERRPSDWTTISPYRSKLTQRRYLRKKQPLLPGVLRQTRAEVESLWPVTGRDADWTLHGAELAVIYDGDQVRRVRTTLPAGFTDYHRLGLDAGRPIRKGTERSWPCSDGKPCLSPATAGLQTGQVLELWQLK